MDRAVAQSRAAKKKASDLASELDTSRTAVENLEQEKAHFAKEKEK